MDTSELKSPAIIFAILILAFFLLIFTQGNPTQFFLLPILLLTFLISWYLHHELQKDHEENIKQGIRYAKEEKDAELWLHSSFVPRLRSLAKQHILSVIIASGIILLSSIFFWSFFVSGLITALLNTGLSLVLFVLFIAYSLTAPKELTHIFKHVPRKYRHHSKNQWIHGYLLLLPFAILCFFLYSLTTIGDLLTILLGLPNFVFFYTLFVICLYCANYLYQDYKRDEENDAKKTARKILED